MPDAWDYDQKTEALDGHRQQTQQLLNQIRQSETWFYLGTPFANDVKQLRDFIPEVGDGHWLLFTEYHLSREQVHEMFHNLQGQEHAGWMVESITQRFVVQPEIMNVPRTRWVRLREVIDDVPPEVIVPPSNEWVECADVCVKNNGQKRTFHLLMFGLNSYQAIVLLGSHHIFPRRVIGHSMDH